VGAEQFFDTALGTNIEEAFRAAVEEARYEHGHGGYTGTLAEKDEYTIITNTLMSPTEAVALAEKLLQDNDRRVSDKWGPAGAIPVKSRERRQMEVPIPPGVYTSERDAVEGALELFRPDDPDMVIVNPPETTYGDTVERHYIGPGRSFRVLPGSTFPVTVEYGEPAHTCWLFFGWASS
jgi:hypothetical protein